MRVFSLCVLCLALLGCGDVEDVQATVIHVRYQESSTFNRSSGYYTTVKTEDGRVDTLYGYLGEEGGTLRGYWVTNSWDPQGNGFRNIK